jgi:glycosyltransferase involved in cell wall biosynthesis
MPTTVDTDATHNPDRQSVRKEINEITVGWTGSYSTLKYLKLIEQVIAEIQFEYPHVRFLVIADRPPDISLPAMRFKKWNPASEIPDLLEIDIGVMPLHDDAWTRGKSGFKCVQYMALKIPAVASGIGVITEIIQDGITGYLVRTPGEWKSRLVALIKDKGLRQRLGEAGRQKILRDYSVVAHSSSFLSLFE